MTDLLPLPDDDAHVTAKVAAMSPDQRASRIVEIIDGHTLRQDRLEFSKLILDDPHATVEQGAAALWPGAPIRP